MSGPKAALAARLLPLIDLGAVESLPTGQA
jgi:hypothetical protein